MEGVSIIMSDVYLIEPDGSTAAMDQVQCRDEEKELQEILEKIMIFCPAARFGLMIRVAGC